MSGSAAATRKVRITLRPGATFTVVENGEEYTRTVRSGDYLELDGIDAAAWHEYERLERSWPANRSSPFRYSGGGVSGVFDAADIILLQMWPGTGESR